MSEPLEQLVACRRGTRVVAEPDRDLDRRQAGRIVGVDDQDGAAVLHPQSSLLLPLQIMRRKSLEIKPSP